MSSPEQIQRQIERTRSQLSDDVDRLSEKVSPGRVMSRNVGRVKSSASSLRDRVMGSAEAGTGVRGAHDSLGDAADTVKDSVASAPQAIRGRTEGNPLAAGMIAFGVGLLVSSLAPASRAEQQLAANAETKAKELAEPLKQTGQELAQELKEPAQRAAEQLKSTAAEAASDTAEQAKSAAQDVKQPLRQ